MTLKETVEAMAERGPAFANAIFALDAERRRLRDEARDAGDKWTAASRAGKPHEEEFEREWRLSARSVALEDTIMEMPANTPEDIRLKFELVIVLAEPHKQMMSALVSLRSDLERVGYL